jgi:hypothetical protein
VRSHHPIVVIPLTTAVEVLLARDDLDSVIARG